MTSSDLFEIKNNFIIGNYQAAINIASSLKITNENEKLERDIYLYRSYIAQKEYKIVLEEIKNNSPNELIALRLLASYFSDENNRDICLLTIKQWIHDGIIGNNQIMQFVVGLIFFHEQNYEEAFRILYQTPHLEWYIK